jgi:two-component system sensor histidine kinase GlrK
MNMSIFLTVYTGKPKESWGSRLTIFSRVMIGYSTVLIVVMAISVYAILRLHQFNTGMRHILEVDYAILDYEKRLSDSLLAQLRYEKKYFVTKDVTFYDQFLSENEEFNKCLATAFTMADTPQKKDSLEKVKTAYGGYQSLIDKEVGYVRTNQSYHRKWYDYEKEKAVNGILKELGRLVTYSKVDLQDRIADLKKFSISARAFAILMSALAIILAIATAFFFTRGIAKPLRVLMDKTKEISRGVFECNLNVSSPPEIVELAEAFKLMCDRLKEVDQIKSDFFSSMSHELRTPLTSIKEGINLLQDGVGGVTTDKQNKLLAILTVESNRLINLVNSFLDLSKMEAGMVTYTFEEGRLGPLIERVIMEMTPLVEARKISLEAKVSEELPLLKMDGERILQALRNLIGNAIKFTPPGGQITVSARLVNSKIEVAITDTGPGIPEENLTTIFEKFHQAPFKYSSQTKGTGLGLAIVKHIITSHGGKVWAESQPGQGSAFIFLLPA